MHVSGSGSGEDCCFNPFGALAALLVAAPAGLRQARSAVRCNGFMGWAAWRC
jgi:hypothetical protein